MNEEQRSFIRLVDNGSPDKVMVKDTGRAFGVISCLLYLCNAICPNNTIKKDIKELFASYPNIPIFMIGFTRAWEENPIWK